MQRRKFIQQTGLTAIGLGVFGNIINTPNGFTGDTATTSDLLGPFYRPGAPLRTNINSKSYKGQLFHISGTVFREDGKTPFKNCLLEIWQCDENKIYDNISEEYNYRGAQRTGADGRYHFMCMHPIPYPVTESSELWRPAHIHLLVSGEGQQDLITQVYLKDDPYLKKDTASSSPRAINRILTIRKNSRGEESVTFNIVMQKEFKPQEMLLKKISGIYRMSDNSLMEFFKKGDLLFLKWNGQFREGLSYRGNNEFTGSVNGRTMAKFEWESNNQVSVRVNFYRQAYDKDIALEGKKAFKY